MLTGSKKPISDCRSDALFCFIKTGPTIRPKLKLLKSSSRHYITESTGVSQCLKNLVSPLVILSVEKTMSANVISELKYASSLKILSEKWSQKI